MTVIKDEFKSRDISRHDLLPLSFLKKSVYTGSKRQLSYKLAKTELEPAVEGEKPEVVLRVYCWKGVYAFSETDPALIKQADFSFDDKGIDDAVIYLNSMLKELL